MKKYVKRIIILFLCFILAEPAIPQIAASASAKSTSCTVYFNAEGGKVNTASKTVTFGNTYGTLPVPTRTNYQFEGWCTFESGGDMVTETSLVETAYAHVLYARWLGNICTIKLNANGGKVSQKTAAVHYGSKYLFQLPKPTRDNYIFSGWYTAAQNGNLIKTDSVFNEKSAKTIYAHWEAKTLKVIFIAFNGEDYEKVVTCGKAIGTLPKPKRKNYTFGGWYLRKDYSDYNAKPVTKDTIVSDSADFKLLARWNKAE